MPVCLDNLLVVGISSRALFDLEVEEAIFRTQALEAYRPFSMTSPVIATGLRLWYKPVGCRSENNYPGP